MEKKNSLKTFIKTNKGKIVRATLLVVGIAASVVLYKTYKTTLDNIAENGTDGLDTLQDMADGLSNGAEVLGTITTI